VSQWACTVAGLSAASRVTMRLMNTGFSFVRGGPKLRGSRPQLLDADQASPHRARTAASRSAPRRRCRACQSCARQIS